MGGEGFCLLTASARTHSLIIKYSFSYRHYLMWNKSGLTLLSRGRSKASLNRKAFTAQNTKGKGKGVDTCSSDTTITTKTLMKINRKGCRDRYCQDRSGSHARRLYAPQSTNILSSFDSLSGNRAAPPSPPFAKSTHSHG